MEKDFLRVDTLLDAACRERKIPGAVILHGRNGETVFHKAYGCAQWEPEEAPMTEDTLFDLASLSKVTATWPCIVRLLEKGVISLEETLPDLLPDWEIPAAYRPITLLQLLTHTAGLAEDEDLDGFGDSREERVRGVVRLPLKYPIGSGVHYSDMGFILLGEIAACWHGMPLDRAAARIWAELGMAHICFNPPRDGYFAATEKVNGVVTRGWVHDERAQQLFGVAGHAGVFSNVSDLAVYCANLLPGRGGKICSDEWLRRSFALHAPDDYWNRGLAWVVHRVDPRGNVVGHTGFTGTSLWIDTASGDYTVLLTNRVHPTRQNGNLQPLRLEIRTILYGELS